MIKLSKLNLQQRFNVVIFSVISISAALIVLIILMVLDRYSTDYSSRLWQGHTMIFAESIKYSVIIDSQAMSKDVVSHFRSDPNIIKVAAYNNKNELFVTSNTDTIQCKTNEDFTITKVSKEYDKWCFYVPMMQDNVFVGHGELVVSTLEYRRLIKISVLIAAVTVAVFSLIIYIVIRNYSSVFLKTLSQIIVTLNSFAQGNKSQRIELVGPPDIESTGTALNRLLDQIDKNEKILEDTVLNRTKELSIALRQSQSANKYKNQIMAIVSHEMKTPLHVIMQNTELAQELIGEANKVGECTDRLNKVLKRAQELNVMISNMLLHGKLNADKHVVNKNKFNINDLVTVCIHHTDPILIRNRNELVVAGEEINICTDKEILQHIVENLMSNACKFTTDGLITIRWFLKSMSLVISIEDTGCGVPEEFHQKIFDEFWQVDMSMTRKVGGHGLGLAITMQFVNLLNGQITVKSNTDNVGSVFTVIIPVEVA